MDCAFRRAIPLRGVDLSKFRTLHASREGRLHMRANGVTPAKAGVQFFFFFCASRSWIPAFAGMTRGDA